MPCFLIFTAFTVNERSTLQIRPLLQEKNPVMSGNTEMFPNFDSAFSSDLQFCPVCGSILPLPTFGKDTIQCARCPFKRNLREYDEVVEEFVIHFNTPKKKKKKASGTGEEAEPAVISASDFTGPTVERQCPKCQNDIMTYTTRQTRSADEGQTVFYSCVKCKFQDIEYS